MESSEKVEEMWSCFKTVEEVTYPKIVFTLSLEVSSKVASYIDVKAINDGELLDLGKTETVITNSDRTNDTIDFLAVFEIIYYVGIGENQFLLLKIMDGDTLGISRGYVVSSVELRISEIIKRSNRFPILLGENDLWGYIIVKSRIEEQIVSIDFKTHALSSRFFRGAPPTAEKTRESTPFFLQNTIFHHLSLSCSKLFNYSAPGEQATSDETRSIYLLLCSHNTGSNLSVTSPSLKCLWKSRTITKHPYMLNALDISLTK
jgi:hypothetical protein